MDQLKSKIEELYTNYKDDDYILNKLINHINNDLSNILDNMKKQQKFREERKLLLIEGHDNFVKKFINKNIYYYCFTSEIFFKYDKLNYYNIKEDNILHDILSTLTHGYNENKIQYYKEQLYPWKFKIKTSIIKQLKEMSIFTSIPESDTIQLVINLFKDIFLKTKNSVKYFLTVIGDAIFKKHTNCIFLISPSLKSLIRLLENQSGKFFGHIPIQNSFRYKYHDHNYTDCRLLDFVNLKENTEIIEVLFEKIQKNIINIFVVSSYFSRRYENSDGFLNKCQDKGLQNYSYFLKNNSPQEVIDKFILSKLEISEDNSISMKNMLYLWKCYLEENCFPYIIFYSNLKILLKEKLNFDEKDEKFHGYTSLSIPIVSNFCKFWEGNIKESVDELFIEIEELCFLFKYWLGNKSSSNIEEHIILNLIRHFYPDINIENNKIILSISCTLWNKKHELYKFLEQLKDTKSNESTLYELYKEYITKKHTKSFPLIISKTYFDLFINEYKEQKNLL